MTSTASRKMEGLVMNEVRLNQYVNEHSTRLITVGRMADHCVLLRKCYFKSAANYQFSMEPVLSF